MLVAYTKSGHFFGPCTRGARKELVSQLGVDVGKLAEGETQSLRFATRLGEHLLRLAREITPSPTNMAADRGFPPRRN